MRDALKDPQPGDVIQIRPDWTRTIESNDGKYVGFRSKVGDADSEFHVVRADRWAAALDGICAEVIQLGPPASAGREREGR